MQGIKFEQRNLQDYIEITTSCPGERRASPVRSERVLVDACRECIHGPLKREPVKFALCFENNPLYAQLDGFLLSSPGRIIRRTKRNPHGIIEAGCTNKETQRNIISTIFEKLSFPEITDILFRR